MTPSPKAVRSFLSARVSDAETGTGTSNSNAVEAGVSTPPSPPPAETARADNPTPSSRSSDGATGGEENDSKCGQHGREGCGWVRIPTQILGRFVADARLYLGREADLYGDSRLSGVEPIPAPKSEDTPSGSDPAENPAEWLLRRFGESRDKYSDVPANWDLPIQKADEAVQLIAPSPPFTVRPNGDSRQRTGGLPVTHLASQRRRERTDKGPGPFRPDHLEDRGVFSPDGRLCYALLLFYQHTPAKRWRTRDHFEAYDDLLPVGGPFAQVSTDFDLAVRGKA